MKDEEGPSWESKALFEEILRLFMPQNSTATTIGILELLNISLNEQSVQQ